jgi:uncharacterized protein (DUF2062 family)
MYSRPESQGRRKGFWYRRIGTPILELLRQGVTPEKLALSIALGTALGVIPVLGTTTALCALAALILRLNLPAIQIVNYFVYPAQIALLIPFFRFGEWIFRAPHLPLSVTQIVSMVRANYWHAMRLLCTTTWHAVVAWCLVAPILAAVMYIGSVIALRRAIRREQAA